MYFPLILLADTVLVAQLGLVVAQAATYPTLSLSRDDSFNFELLVPLGESLYGAADISPVLHAATDLQPGNFTSFTSAFYKLANHTRDAAEDLRYSYDPINVQRTYFAASNYYRRADFYAIANWSNPLVDELWNQQTIAFNRAIASMPIPGQRLKIPADGFHVDAIFYSVDPPGSKQERPTIILGNGYDAAQEDMLHFVGFPALERGWNVITYEGPGQPTVRRNQSLGFIYDWERVVTPVVDYLQTRSNVNKSCIALFGNSFGGYLAARAAAFEPRLAALILDGGVYDAHAAFVAQLSPDLLQLYRSGQKAAFDAAGKQLLNNSSLPSTQRWGLAQGLWSFKTQSPYELFERLKNYSISDVVHRIQVPTWIANAEFEQFFPNQSAQVATALGDRATLHNFTGASGYHVQAGAAEELNRVLFAWLNRTLS